MSKVTSFKARHLSLKMARVPSSIWSALHSASGVWSTRETVRLSSDAGTPPLLSLLLSPSLLRVLRSRGPEFELFARSPLSGVCERAHTRERCHCRLHAAAGGSQPLHHLFELLLHAAG